MKLWHLSLLLFLSLSLVAQPAASQAEKAEAISIEADRLELNQGKGISHYTGNVVLTRGSLQIRAESITLYTLEKKLHRAVAAGNPAQLQQQATAEAGAMRAEAETMEYLPQSELVELKGKAHLWRDGNEFSGEQIRYNLKQQLVKASGDKEGEGRVRVLLQPEGQKTDTEGQP